MVRVRRRLAALSSTALIVLIACTPSLNWREATPEGAGVRMLFPCRPDLAERLVRVAGETMRMRMHSCTAAGTLFSVAVVDVADPTRVTAVLATMRAAAATHLNGTATTRPLVVPGATPNEQSGRVRIEGRLPGAGPVVEHAAFFVRGLRVYQVAALGGSLDDDALEMFFSSIKLMV